MKKAFTLIELLVVIAIIAILSAILFPVFAQAKMAAKKTQCLSNVKQHAAATRMYLADFELFVDSFDGTGLAIATSMAKAMLHEALAEVEHWIQVALASLIRESHAVWLIQQKPSSLFTQQYLVRCSIA
jgi:prepilin-type N-terminal cleavage/methylation domain-containing protein